MERKLSVQEKRDIRDVYLQLKCGIYDEAKIEQAYNHIYGDAPAEFKIKAIRKWYWSHNGIVRRSELA